jgi:hypothetical protein
MWIESSLPLYLPVLLNHRECHHNKKLRRGKLAMSVWMTPYVLPPEGCSLTHDDFTTLVLRVFHEGHGKLPVIVVSGLIAQSLQRNNEQIVYLNGNLVPQDMVTYPTVIPVERYDSVSGEPTGDYGQVTLWYRGDDRDALARTLASIPYEREDVLVAFDGWDGPEIYALTKERQVGFLNAWCPDDEMRKKTQLVCKLGGGLRYEDDVFAYPILPLLAEYFGEEFRVAYTYG